MKLCKLYILQLLDFNFQFHLQAEIKSLQHLVSITYSEWSLTFSKYAFTYIYIRSNTVDKLPHCTDPTPLSSSLWNILLLLLHSVLLVYNTEMVKISWNLNISTSFQTWCLRVTKKLH